MKWVITGGCGFIGRALIGKLLGEGGHSIRVIDNLSVGSREDLLQVAPVSETDLDFTTDLSLVVADILDADAMMHAVQGADVVVHLAANTGVGPSVEDPMLDCRANVLGTLNVLEGCRAAGVKRFVFASSGAPLGVQTPPMHENMAPHPASPYGASKLAGEGYCSAYFHCFEIGTVVLRFGNVYGEGSTKKASVVAKFIKQALNGEVLEIYGDGSQTRDFVYLGDLVKAIHLAATVPGIGGEVFQIATSAETTLGDLTERLVAAIKSESGIEPKWVNGEHRIGDVARNFSDTSKAQEVLGWRAETTLEDGLRKTVRFFVQ